MMQADNQFNEGLVSGQPANYATNVAGVDPQRTPNFPPCKPIIYHNINEMPTESGRSVVKKALYGWFGLCCVLIVNLIAMSVLYFEPICPPMMDCMGSGYSLSWGMSILLLGAGGPAAFGVYLCLYSASRKNSPLWYCCFGIGFVLAILLMILLMLGIPDWGSAGLVELIIAVGADKPAAPPIVIAISMILWGIAVAYSTYLLMLVRKEYNGAGGLAAARKEATHAAAQTAYDNRETIKEVAWENRDVIKQVAVENKDLIMNVASENKGAVVQLAKDNPDLAWQMAVAAAQAPPGAVTSSSAAAPIMPPASNPFAAPMQPAANPFAPTPSAPAAMPPAQQRPPQDDINWSEFS